MNSRPRKALIVHHSGLLGGAGRSLVDLVTGLRPDLQVSVYVPAEPAELAHHLRMEGIEATTFDFRMAKIPYYSGGEEVWHPRLWFYVCSIGRQTAYWRRVISHENPDIVIANSSVIAWLSALAPGRLSTLMVRETLKGGSRSLMNRALRRLRERFTFVTYLSEYDRKADGLRRATTLVIPDAVDPSNFEDRVGRANARRALGIRESGPVALFLGGSNRLKGLDLLLKSLALTRNEDLHLLVAGQAPQPGRRGLWRISPHRRFDHYALGLLAEGRVRERVSFVGSREDVATLYSACDFVVFPMKQPHQARPAFEVGFQGKPVVITDFPNIHGCVTDEVNGLLFSPGRPDELALCLDRLAQDPLLVKRLGEQNKLHAYAKHNHAVVYEQFRRMLAEASDHVSSRRDPLKRSGSMDE